VYRFLFEKISVMRVAFRNIQYLTVFVSIGYAYMMGRVLDVFGDDLKSKGSAYSIILGHIILVIAVFELPFMTGGMSGHVQTVKFDRVYEGLVKEIESDSSDARTLWLPISQPIMYKKKRLPGLDSFFVGSSKGFVINDGAGALDRTLSEEMYTTSNPQSIQNLLALLNVERVILRSDFYSHHPDFMNYPFWKKNNFLWNNKILRENIDDIPSLNLLEERGPTKIFKNNFFAPHFYIADRYVGISGDLTDFSKVVEIGNYSPRAAYKFIKEDDKDQSVFDGIYYLPFSVSDNLPSMVYSAGNHSTDALWVWPNCSISPASIAYKGISIKESILSFGKNNPEDKLENLVWLAAKRICEIDTYHYELSSEEIEELLQEFLYGFKKAYQIILEVKKESSWEEYISLARKVAFYYERSLSVLVDKVLGAVEREDVKGIYWDLYSLGLAEARGVEGHELSFDLAFLVDRPGNYNLYTNLGFNGEINIFDSSEASVGSTRVSVNIPPGEWREIYRGLDISETGDISVKISTQKGSNLADTRRDTLNEMVGNSSVVPVATATEWESGENYLVSFDYSFGTGDFKAIFIEEVPKIIYYRYGDGYFDWFDYDQSEIYWENFVIFDREFRNSLNFNKQALESLGACIYWEGDVCYRRFSSLINSNAVSKNPLLFIQGISATERQDLGKLSIKNVQIVKISKPDLVLADTDSSVSIKSADIIHKKVNQSKYVVTINSFEGEAFRLVFSEGFNKRWKIYLREQSPRKGIFSGVFEKISGDTNPFETLGKKSLFMDTHNRVNSYANSWVIDTTMFEGRSLPIELVVEFGPQKAHYLWILITASTFIGISLYFIRRGIENVYGKK